MEGERQMKIHKRC